MTIEQQLTDWYHRELGQNVAHGVNAVLKQMLANCFGKIALQIGGPHITAWLNSTPIETHIYLDNPKQKYSNLIARYDELPIACDSVDLIVLPHTLEYS